MAVSRRPNGRGVSSAGMWPNYRSPLGLGLLTWYPRYTGQVTVERRGQPAVAGSRSCNRDDFSGGNDATNDDIRPCRGERATPGRRLQCQPEERQRWRGSGSPAREGRCESVSRWRCRRRYRRYDHGATATEPCAGQDSGHDGSGAQCRGAGAQRTLEVPPASFSEVLDRLAKLGEQVSRKSATDDVTQQVADVNSRLESMRASLDRVRALYATAVSIRDVISIESEVAEREADYESLQAQQRGLTKQAAHSIVHLQLVAKQVVVAHARKHSTGVLDKFGRGWDAFVATARWTLGAIGTVLPFLVLFGGIGVVALWLRRRR